jgi:DNA-binding PadR family transcriptional regulator
MVPDTRYAILGLLLRGPSHGYELATRFGELFGPGWAINRGQVYDMLHTLEDEGLVERLGPPDPRRNSQRYRITHKGERAFAKWLSKPSSYTRPHREVLYLKLALAGPRDAHHLLEAIDIQRQACVDRLSAYTAENACRPPADASEWETLAREMIDEDVTTRLHGELEWLEKVQKSVEHRLLERSQDSPEDTGAQSRRRDATA